MSVLSVIIARSPSPRGSGPTRVLGVERGNPWSTRIEKVPLRNPNRDSGRRRQRSRRHPQSLRSRCLRAPAVVHAVVGAQRHGVAGGRQHCRGAAQQIGQRGLGQPEQRGAAHRFGEATRPQSRRHARCLDTVDCANPTASTRSVTRAGPTANRRTIASRVESPSERNSAAAGASSTLSISLGRYKRRAHRWSEDHVDGRSLDDVLERLRRNVERRLRRRLGLGLTDHHRSRAGGGICGADHGGGLRDPLFHRRAPCGGKPQGTGAEDVLAERFARGEIDEDDYRARMTALHEHR